MAKVISDGEIAGIITTIVANAPQRDEPRYRVFLETIAEAVGAYYALGVGGLGLPDGDRPRWSVCVTATPDTPRDGGPFAAINPDVPLNEWLDEGATASV